ncbi:YraN family protein [Desulforhopalus singaporensis]|uniref:UPF0102 protein SAMN05660330_01058 n=1 Tax=Desulforhopalus singaporensis TaxID=91360 RepID=A0A1H0MI22_9BACT|nr:YraN family protein [Desulforhopalus singaporensis]SDO80011.1 putative endonuclease [Desulforhopalus singaporensis]
MLNRLQLLGKNGEKRAAGFLKRNGFKLVEQNFRCRYGEIDIIAYDGPCLVFVEVKTRSSNDYGNPLSAVTARKQQQICKAAQLFLAQKNLYHCQVRFDVVAVLHQKGQPPRIDLVKNAFEYCL